MGISYIDEQRIFKLDTEKSTYIIQIYDEGYLLNLYYGKKIPDCVFPGFDKRFPCGSTSLGNPRIGENGFTLDTAPVEYGCNGAGDYRAAALAVRNSDGDTVTDVRYLCHRIYQGKKPIPGMPSTYVNPGDRVDTLEIDALDSVTGLKITLVYNVFENYPVITRHVIASNTGTAPLNIERIFSLCGDFNSCDYDLITLWGAHLKERSVERRHLCHGLQGVESKRGVSGHCQNPFAALVSPEANEEYGEVFAYNLVYSGNFSFFAECDYNDTVRVLMGINPADFEWRLEPGESFEAPEAVCVYTDKGTGEMSRIFHRFYNNNLIRGKYKTERRPVLINSWEAALMDFDTEKLLRFARSAREMGMEMLVMDDGWFGRRDDDWSSLGDWYVNEKKLPGGLKPLIDGVNELGMKFGIWFEPEMISPDSDLFRAHPDWHVHVSGREPMVGRHQYVLDVSRQDVRDNIWAQMKKILSENRIDYIKWDFNRNISDAGSALLPPERKKEFFHRFILGTYDLMNRLVTEFPDILFENCSGGGGRFDPAMLAYSPQIWTSDNTDAIARLKIQFGTSMCYPASTMGAHVSANARTDYETKVNVALWGSFGYELDPDRYTPEEKMMVRRQIEDYHRLYDLIHNGDLYRIISPFDDPSKAAWMLVTPDKSEFLFTVVCVKYTVREHFVVKLRGLDPDRYYRNEADGTVFSGALLMYAGLDMSGKLKKDGDSIRLHFTEAGE